MRILIAEDDPVSRRVLEVTLVKWGYEVIIANDGDEALAALKSEVAPSLAILDWMMPGLAGVDVCRQARQLPTETPVYIILLTAKSEKEDIVAGLESGADDYLTKPFNREELRARVKVGERVINLQNEMSNHLRELENALAQVKLLQGILPICSYCKNVRDDQNYWQQVETYITKNSEAKFSHSICPDCYENTVKPQLERRKQRQE